MRSTGHDAKYRIDAVGAIPILIFVLLAILLKMFGLDNAFVYEPPDFLTILNTIFLFGCPLLVVYIAAKGYLENGSTRLMTLESGVLSFAIGSLIAGFMLPWKGPNGVITLHNCSVLLAGLLHLFGAASALAGARMEQDVHGRVPRLFLVNAGILILMFLLTFGAVQEKLPVFFVQGQGPTLLRQIVLGTAIFSFLISGFMFLKLYSDSRSRFFYWYAMALFLITIGLFCVFIQKSFGDPIGWLGRTAQYMAGLYLIAGVFRGARELELGVLRMDKILVKLFRSRFEKLLEERTEQLSLVNDELCKENERRRQSEERLRLEKAILSRTEMLAHVGSWEWDIATDTVNWSDELFRIFQRDPQEGAPSLAEHPALYHPDDMARLQKAVEAAVAEGTPYELELRAIRKDGMTRVCKVYGVAEKGQVGRAIRLFGSLQDITEQKQAEEALHESKKHYRSLVEGTPGIVYSFSSKRGSVYCSSHVTDILGYSPEQLYAQPMLWHNSIHPDDLSYVNQIIREGTTSKPFCIEYRIQDAHGNWRWFEDRSTGYKNDGADIIMEGLALDITERKHIEKELLDSRWRLKSIIEGTHVGTWEWNVQTGETVFNETWAEIVGYTIDELSPISIKTWEALVHPDDRKHSGELLEQHFTGELPYYDCECRMKHKDGHWVWVRDCGRVITRSVDDKPLMMFGTHTDITKRKHTEGALRESEERLRNAQRIGKLGSLDWNLATNDLVLSEETLSIYGLEKTKTIVTLEEIITFVHPEDKQRVEQSLNAAIVNKVRHDLEHRVIRPDGEVIYIRAMAELFHDTDGKSVRLLGTIMDITDSKKAEVEKAQLEAQNRQLQKAESLGRMAGAIAHHFNNQLYVVMGNLEMAMDNLPLGVTSNESLVSAMQAARKAADVSRLMLTYLGQRPGKQEPIDLSETCRQSLTLLNASAPEWMILNADFPPSGPVILSDTNQIHQILTNLITNAWESISDNRGTIGLTVKTVSATNIPTSKRFPIDWQPQSIPYACLEVSDNGCGILNNDIEKLFDPFFTTKFTGRGLGLPVVMGIVKAHGGGVTVESEPGHGSTFRIFLPVSTEKLLLQHDLPVVSEALPTSKAQTLSKFESGVTVLLIEDEEQVRNMAKMMLTRLGHTVLEAKDGVEAIEIFQQHQDKICFVLSDLTMPRMDGWETLAALRKLSPGIPVVLSSGYDEVQVMAGEHSERPNAFLGKPYQFKGLRETINCVLADQK